MLTSIILAGGESKRMGTDKAFLKLQGKTFLRHILEAVSKYSDQIIISGNREEELYLRECKGIDTEVSVVRDLYPYSGPLNGIISCYDQIKNEKLFIATCDTPLLKHELIPFLLNELNGFDGVIPVIDNKIQPLNTVYTKKAVEIGRKIYTEKGIRSLKKWIDFLKHKKIFKDKIIYIDKDLSSYLSVNTPKLYEVIRRKVKEC
ncbi:molybdenum cofactor guanylyltransferase [Persephonella sp.]